MSDKDRKPTYEEAWKLRLCVIEELRRQGESHPLRLIHRLYAHERFNRIAVDGEGMMRYVPSVDMENPYKFPVLPTGMPAYRVIAVRDKYEIVPFYHSPVEFLVDFLKDKKLDAIVELGSGYGRNLVELFYRGGPRSVPYYAGEYTESGTAIAQTLACLDPALPLVPFRFDHNDPDLSAVKERGNVLFLTVHSIEQVHVLRSDYFRALAAHAERAVGVHFEPFGFQLVQFPGEVNDAQQRLFVQSKWNMNFVSVLRDSAARGEIEIALMAKNVMDSGDPNNPTSLALWTAPKQRP